MLSSQQFDGDAPDIECRKNAANSNHRIGNYSNSLTKDFKKANVGNTIASTMPNWPLSSSFEKTNMLHCAKSLFFTDGPLLENQEQISHKSYLSSTILDCFRDLRPIRVQNEAMAISPKKVDLHPLSLSPLAPRTYERMRSSRGCRYTAKAKENSNVTLKSIKSLEGSKFDFAFPSECENLGIESKTFEVVYISQYPTSLEDQAGRCTRFARSLSGLSVRRSLVGSVEESLFSGRFLSGNFSHVCADLCYNSCMLLD